jgi:hypothetical protein
MCYFFSINIYILIKNIIYYNIHFFLNILPLILVFFIYRLYFNICFTQKHIIKPLFILCYIIHCLFISYIKLKKFLYITLDILYMR